MFKENRAIVKAKTASKDSELLRPILQYTIAKEVIIERRELALTSALTADSNVRINRLDIWADGSVLLSRHGCHSKKERRSGSAVVYRRPGCNWQKRGTNMEGRRATWKSEFIVVSQALVVTLSWVE
jgi:hypothetical protein